MGLNCSVLPQRREALEFEFSSKGTDIIFPEGEGGVRILRVWEVVPRERVQVRTQLKKKRKVHVITCGRREFEFSLRSGSGGRAGAGSSTLSSSSIRNIFFEKEVGIVGPM